MSLSWVPLFHDLGLVDGILQPIFSNFISILMPPIAFIQKPERWLTAVSKYKVTKTIGPNFAYDLCVKKIDEKKLDNLNFENVQYFRNAAEFINYSTLNKFFQKFERFGLRRVAIDSGYGLAEAVVQVTGCKINETYKELSIDKFLLSQNIFSLKNDFTENSTRIVSVGYPFKSLELQIVNPNTFRLAADNEIGEVWIKGKSVSPGYWRCINATEAVFKQTIVGTNQSGYLRTGDLGFLHEGELYITGRIKELMIIRGKNYYPQDFELLVRSSHSSFETNNGTIAFSIFEEKEKVVIVQEILRSHYRALKAKKAITEVKKHLANSFEIEVDEILLVAPLSIPKTSSGKLMRLKCREMYKNGELNILHKFSKLDLLKKQLPVSENKVNFVKNVLITSIHEFIEEGVVLDDKSSILNLGIDSINLAEISNNISEKLKIEIDPTLFYEFETIDKITEHLNGLFENRNI